MNQKKRPGNMCRDQKPWSWKNVSTGIAVTFFDDLGLAHSLKELGKDFTSYEEFP